MQGSEFEDPQWTEESGGTAWAFIAVGFLGGLLLGGFLLWNNVFSEPAAEETVEAEPFVSVSSSAPSPSAVKRESHTQATQLQRENTRLREELKREKLKRETAQMRGELSALKNANRSSAPKPRAKQSKPPVPAARNAGAKDASLSKGARTLAYWNRMNAIFAEEAEMRAVPAGGLKASNAAEFLQRRTSAGQFAAQSLRGMDKSDVDGEVVQLAMEIANWYDKGVSNSSNASGLLGAGRKTRQGSQGKQWKSAEKNHSRQVNSLNAQGEQVRARMSKKYGMPFPPMQ